MDENLRRILDDVAAGRVSPADAEARLSGPSEMAPVRSVVIRVGAVRLSVVADPSVADAVVTGPALTRRFGDELQITADPGEAEGSGEAPRSAFMSWVSQMANRVGAAMEVRVNPALPVRVLVVGGTLDIDGLCAGVFAGVEAGTATVTGSGPLALEVTSGSGRVDWTFTGQSRVKAEMGSVSVLVRPDSNVSITAESAMGQSVIKTHGGNLKSTAENPVGPIAVGAGEGTLAVNVRMGSAQVTIG